MEKKKKGTWGGKREGAGRKPMGEEAHTSPVFFSVRPGILRKVQGLREATKQDDMPFNRMFEKWVEDLAQEYGIE